MKIKLFFIIFITIFILTPFYLFSETPNFSISNNQNNLEKKSTQSYEVGLQIGTAGGYGIAFKYCNYGYGIQVNTFPFIDFVGNYIGVPIGLLFLKEIANYEWSILYFYLINGNNFIYNNYGSVILMKYNMNLSFGPGIEMFIDKHNAINILIGIAIYDIINNFGKSLSLLFNIEFSYMYRI